MFALPILSILGLLNALFLHWQYLRMKRTGTNMYCFLGEDCSKVVGSEYGSHFGVKNEIIGITYYIGIGIYSWMAFYIRLPQFATAFIFIAGFGATLFSFYLLYLQARVLKTFCSWCLIAILINFLIFANLFANSGLI